MTIDHSCASGSIYLSLARSLLSCNDFTKVKKFLDLCPKPEPHAGFRLDSRSQSAILGLGTFLVESNLKFVDKCLPYLLTVQKKLHKCCTPEFVSNDTFKLPPAECFTFCLSNLLLQISLMDPTKADLIMSTLIESASNILEQIDDACQQLGDRGIALPSFLRQSRSRRNSPSSLPETSKAAFYFSSLERICLFLAPSLAGILRGMASGRCKFPFSKFKRKALPCVVSGLYPPPELHQKPPPHEHNCSYQHLDDRRTLPDFISQVFPNFRSIVPHSLTPSLSLIPQEDPGDSIYASCASSPPFEMAKSSTPSNVTIDWSVWNSAWLDPAGSEYLFNQIASVYASRLPHRAVISDDYLSSCLTASQLGSLSQSADVCEASSLSFNGSQVKALLKLSNQLMNERFLRRLDSLAEEYWPYRPKNGRYPYRSYGHCLRLCWLLLIRELVYNPERDFGDKVLTSMQSLMLDVYSSCISELSRLSTETCGLTTTTFDKSTNNGRKMSTVASASALSTSLKVSGRPRFSNPTEDDDSVPCSALNGMPDSHPLRAAYGSAEENNQNKVIFPGKKSMNPTRVYSTSRERASTHPPDTSTTFDSCPSSTASGRRQANAPALFAFDFVAASTATCIQILTQVVTDMGDSESLLARLLERVATGIDPRAMLHAERGLEQSIVLFTPSSGQSVAVATARGMQQFLRGHLNVIQRQFSVQPSSGHHKSSLANHLPHKPVNKPHRTHFVCSAGLLMVVLECVGQLPQRFPYLAKATLDALSDFLLDPSPTLSRLNRQLRRLENSRQELVTQLSMRKRLLRVLFTDSELGEIYPQHIAGEIWHLECCFRRVGDHPELSQDAGEFTMNNLPIVSGRLSCSISALGVRCRLVEMCLNLLQNTLFKPAPLPHGTNATTDEISSAAGGGSSAGSLVSGGGIAAGKVANSGASLSSHTSFEQGYSFPLSRVVLREKAYAAILNHFAVKPHYPIHKGADLAEDLKALSRVWSLMQAEKKYLSSGIVSAEMDSLIEASGRYFTQSVLTPSHTETTPTNPGGPHSPEVIGIPFSNRPTSSVATATGMSNSPRTPQVTSSSSPNIQRIFPHFINDLHNANTVTGGTLPRLRSQAMFLAGQPLERPGVGSLILPSALQPTNSSTVHVQPSAYAAHSIVSKRSSAPGKPGGHRTNGDNYLKQLCLRKRELILLLLASEIERLSVWLNPQGDVALVTSKENEADVWLRDTLLREKNWQRWASLAWELNPSVAVHMPQRFAAPQSLRREISTLVKFSPQMVSHVPGALQYLATSSNLEEDVPELMQVLTWAPVAPIVALSFFSRMYPQHPVTHQYAVRVLNNYPSETMLFYVPQLVQGVRYDKLGYLTECILDSAKRSPLLAHQLLWNM
ncbi:unnamed protein product, partial [Dicrocoelium dendriticum]